MLILESLTSISDKQLDWNIISGIAGSVVLECSLAERGRRRYVSLLGTTYIYKDDNTLDIEVVAVNGGDEEGMDKIELYF